MFEDFRKQAEQAEFPDEDPIEELRLESHNTRRGHFLGLTPFQRFIVASMLLVMTILVGTLFLVVTSRLSLPFLG